MTELRQDELIDMKGGAFINPWIAAGVGALIVFGVGFIDGIARPLVCNKKN